MYPWELIFYSYSLRNFLGGVGKLFEWDRPPNFFLDVYIVGIYENDLLKY